MKKLIGMTVVSLMTMVNSIQAMPLESVTKDAIITTEDGYTVSRTESSVINRLDNVAASYMPEIDSLSTTTLVDKYKEADGAITTIIAEQAKVRATPSQEGNIINFINKGIPIFVKERIDNWYLVEFQGSEGYIYKEQLDESPLSQITYTRSESNQLEEEVYLGEEIVEKAKQYLGNPYVYGGTSLTKGADCSGFVQQVFKQFDIQLQRSSRTQFASNGYKVSKKDLLPGDLVFYGYNGYIDHVAIYAGNGQIVHANSPKTGISMGKLQYGKPIIGMKRVIK